jgi:hypothetical protein
MLWTLAVFLIVLWLLGMITSYTLGGFVHILLAVALIVVLVRVIQGRRLRLWNRLGLPEAHIIRKNTALRRKSYD